MQDARPIIIYYAQSTATAATYTYLLLSTTLSAATGARHTYTTLLSVLR